MSPLPDVDVVVSKSSVSLSVSLSVSDKNKLRSSHRLANELELALVSTALVGMFEGRDQLIASDRKYSLT